MSDKLSEALIERGTNYGDFTYQAGLSQGLKNMCFEHLENVNPNGSKEFAPYMSEGLEMILHKIARICNGDPLHLDSWRDIAGYATIVADRVEAKLTGAPVLVRGRVPVHTHLHESADVTGAVPERSLGGPEVRIGVQSEG